MGHHVALRGLFDLDPGHPGLVHEPNLNRPHRPQIPHLRPHSAPHRRDQGMIGPDGLPDDNDAGE